MKFRYVRLTPDSLAGGRPLAFGDEVSLTRSEVNANRRLIDEGWLRAIPAADRKSKQTERSDD